MLILIEMMYKIIILRKIKHLFQQRRSAGKPFEPDHRRPQRVQLFPCGRVAEMAELFDRDVKTIGKHINNAVNIILVNYSVTELPEHLN